MRLGNHFIKTETEEQPKMLEVRMNNLYQDVFCYGLAIEEDGREDIIKAVIVAGNDSSLQAIKASMDIGSIGINFGYGTKHNTTWNFQSEIRGLRAEKGKYTRFPLPIEGETAYKAMAIVHDDVLSTSGDYILSFDDNPANDILQYFGGSKHGLYLLPEWKESLYQVLQKKGYLTNVPMYLAEGFKLNLLKLDITEEQGDELISECIRNGLFPFKEGVSSNDGQAIKQLDGLEAYLPHNVDSMMEKVNEQVTPEHDPIHDEAYPYFDDYDRPLFPVQAHVATALVKRLKKQKNVLLEGEMSTGKTTMMTAVADAYARNSGKEGFFSCVMVPPNLTKKWPQEIKDILKNAEVHLIEQSSQLMEYHATWTRKGRPKPTKPTFFVVSYNTMRDGSAIRPALEQFQYKTTQKRIESGNEPYRFGWYCTSCGKPHQKVIDRATVLDEEGNEVEEVEKAVLLQDEFGTTRRVHQTKLHANAFCSECGDSLWTRKVVNRYKSFKEWTTHEKKLLHAINQSNSETLVAHIQKTQEPLKKAKGYPRKVATIDYIKRKMKNFFDLTIVDEIHLTKSGNTAQGNALGALASASKHLVGGTGTLFGGKAEDVFYILYRLFPYLMVSSGYEYNQISKWNHEYGNIEKTTTTYGSDTSSEYSNRNSHGGSQTRSKEKVLPGISPFVYGKFLVQNSCLVRLVDVWPDPVELVDVPTIFVPMNPELKSAYQNMIDKFDNEIHSRKDGKKLYLPLTQNGVAYPDNPFTYPDIDYKLLSGESGVKRQRVWDAVHLDESILLNKEKKLQEIIQDDMNEGRKSIVYVRDTGSSSPGRDVRPRLQKVLNDIGAKVCILDTTTTKTNNRSEWLEKKIVDEDYDVCIVSQELVKVGLDLLCTPTLIFYQFSWSLFTINQAARRAWRIGQTEECRLFYLAYEDSYQEQMAQLIAKKKKATAAISGDVSSDGLSAMLGDEGDLQAMLVKSIQKGELIKGSAEEWVSQTSDRARELLAGVGKKKVASPKVQFVNWVKATVQGESTRNVLTNKAETIVSCIEKGKHVGFELNKGILSVDLVEAFGFDMVDDKAILSYLVTVDRKPLSKPSESSDDVGQLSLFTVGGDDTVKKANSKSKKAPVDGQLGFDLFAV